MVNFRRNPNKMDYVYLLTPGGIEEKTRFAVRFLRDHFPSDSFISIDIRNPAGAARIIRQAIMDNEYEKRLPAIMEARRRVLFEYNFFSVISREIEKRHNDETQTGDHEIIYPRHALRTRKMSQGLRDIYGKARAPAVHLLQRH